VIRSLVEGDGVLAIMGSVRYADQCAIQNSSYSGVPHCWYIAAARAGTPKQYPWTTPYSPTYSTNPRSLPLSAAEKGGRRVGVLRRRRHGKDFLAGLKEGLGAKSDTMIVKDSEPIRRPEPTIDSTDRQSEGVGAPTPS